jgi:hypothetical protein
VQSAQIDAIFESMMPAQRATWREREKLEAEVAKLLKEHVADAVDRGATVVTGGSRAGGR